MFIKPCKGISALILSIGVIAALRISMAPAGAESLRAPLTGKIKQVEDLQGGLAQRRIERGPVIRSSAELELLSDAVGDIAPNTWRKIAGSSRAIWPSRKEYSKLAWGVQGPRSSWGLWSSAAFSGTAFYGMGGGHRSSGLNGVWKFDLETMSWSWARKSTPITKAPGTPGAGRRCPYPELWGEEHGPPALHTYDGIVWSSVARELFLWGGVQYTCFTRGGQAPGRLWAFNPERGRWRIMHRHPRKEAGVRFRTPPGTAELPDGKLLIYGAVKNKAAQILILDPATGKYIFKRRIATRSKASFVQVLWAGNAFYTYNYGAAVQLVRLHMNGNGAWRIGESRYLSSLPRGRGLSYTSGAAYHPPSNSVVYWGGARRVAIHFLDTDKWRQLNFSDPALPKKKWQLLEGKWAWLPGQGIFIGVRYDGVWVWRPPKDLSAASIPLIPMVNTQRLINKTPKGGKIVLTAYDRNGIKRDYQPGAVIRRAGITVQCEPGVHISGGGGKGIIVVSAPNVTIDGCKLSGARNRSRNGSCIWVNPGGRGLVVRNSVLDNCQNGILYSGRKGGDLTIERTTFSRNGAGGRAHQIYFSGGGRYPPGTLTIRNSRFVDPKGDGHQIKTGARHTVIENTEIIGGRESYSRAIDAFAGGELIVRNSRIKQTRSGNYDMIAFAPERRRAWPADAHRILLEGNTFQGNQNNVLIQTWVDVKPTLRRNDIQGIKACLHNKKRGGPKQPCP